MSEHLHPAALLPIGEELLHLEDHLCPVLPPPTVRVLHQMIPERTVLQIMSCHDTSVVDADPGRIRYFFFWIRILNYLFRIRNSEKSLFRFHNTESYVHKVLIKHNKNNQKTICLIQIRNRYKKNCFLLLSTDPSPGWFYIRNKVRLVHLQVMAGSVADPYHFDTDPDPGCEKIYDPDPGWTLIRIPIQARTIRIRIQQKRTKY